MNEACRVSVHTIAWNHRDALSYLLASLHHQEWTDFQCLVVDNASNDGLSCMLRGSFPNVLTLRNFRDLGITHAWNQSLSFAFARWSNEVLEDRFILLTEPDVVFASSTLSEMILAFENDSDLMLAGPKLLRANRLSNDVGEREEIIPTQVVESLGLAITKSRQFIERGHGESDNCQLSNKIQIFGAPTACTMIRASALPLLAFGKMWLDESLPVGQAFWDLAWRASNLGLKTCLVPSAVAWRLAGIDSGLSKRDKLRKHFLHQRLARRNDLFVNRVMHAPWILIGSIRSLVMSLLNPYLIVDRIRLISFWFSDRRLRKSIFAKSKLTSKGLRSWFI